MIKHEFEIEINDKNISFIDDKMENILFFDIETTGFSPVNSNLYLIGYIYYTNGKYMLIQLLAENTSEEEAVLQSFIKDISSFNTIVHYNGDGFDIPYLKHKMQKYNITDIFKNTISFDLYKKINPYRKRFPLENIKQKSIEAFLNIKREDQMDGGTLIDVFKEFEHSGDEQLKQLLLLHNSEDVLGLTKILSILNYIEIFNNISYDKIDSNLDNYIDTDGCEATEWNIRLYHYYNIPTELTFHIGNDFYVKITSDSVIIRVLVIHDILKYFFSNYKDYYYLPVEDIAIHKSVASYVDKKYRKQATAALCYIKADSLFIPAIFDGKYKKFRKDYIEKLEYFQIDKDIIQKPEFVESYVKALLALKK